MANDSKLTPTVRLGPLSHIGAVVKDCEKAAAWWERVLGVGPFSIGVWELDEKHQFRYRGKPGRAKVKAAISQGDGVFIELVQIPLEGETPHAEFFRQHGEGFQHIAFHVQNINQVVADLAKEGLTPTLQYKFEMTRPDGKRQSIEEVYLDSVEHVGGAIQLLEIKQLD